MKKAFVSGCLVLLFIFGTAPSSAAEIAQLPVLFCVYDMGETNAFKPLWKLLQSEGIEYRVLAVDAAAERLKDNNHVIPVSTSADPEHDYQTQRFAHINAQTLTELGNQWQVKMVITGMASRAQAEVLNFFSKQQAAHSIAYYDNLDSFEGKPFVQAFLQEAQNIDRFWVPADVVKSDLSTHALKADAVVEVVGQPSLESWDDTYQQFSAAEIRKGLGIAPERKVVVFAGGYDGTYPEHLKLFIQTMKQHPEWETLITWHPKTDGSLEKSLVAESKVNHIRTIPATVHNTSQLSVAADLVAVHKSTVAIQAAYKGKPVVYIAEPDYTSPLIHYNIAPLASTQGDLEKSLSRAEPVGRFSKLGLPEHGSTLMMELIHKQLGL